jgi:hypothetical protein
MIVDAYREESGWSEAEEREPGVNRAVRGSTPSPRSLGAESCASLVEVVDPLALEGEASPLPGAGTDASPSWVDEELRELHALTFSRAAGTHGLASYRLETTREGAALLGAGALPDLEPLAPLTLPVGSCLTLEEPQGGAGASKPCREVRRLDSTTVRVTAMPSRGVVEEPFAGLGEELTSDVGGTHTLERALGWTADLDLRQPGTLAHYREFLASGEVPVTHRAGGVVRSGRVAVFTDSCAPVIELRFLRDFAWLDGERVECLQRVVEYDDGGVEVRSHARFRGGRHLFSTILVDTAGQQVRGDHSLVLGHLPADAVAALCALFGERPEARRAGHARLRLTDEEALRWRDIARAHVCQQMGMSVGRFEAEARTPDMGAWKGSPQLISLALARTPAEVADAVARFHATAEGLVACLVRLGAVLGTRTPGALAMVSASEV